MRNFMPDRYRDVSVAQVQVPLTTEGLRRHFLGREAYRRTRFIVAKHDSAVAVVTVAKHSDALFAPIVEVEVLAEPEDCAYVVAPDVDTGVPTQMARAAVERAPDIRCVVVQGRYEHVNFIMEPRPIPVRIVEVVPPEPPKLFDQVQRVLGIAEDLPPTELQPELLDLRELARGRRAERYLFPCRGSGVVPDSGEVDYLDQRPVDRQAVLVGCARSREIYRWFYGRDPETLETCPVPRARAGAGPTLTRCCLLEDRIEQDGLVVTVPWGASYDEVRTGLKVLLEAAEPAWARA